MFTQFLIVASLILVNTASSVLAQSEIQSVPSSKSSSTPTRLRFCNRSSSPNINIAFAYFDQGANQWHTVGWYSVKRSNCREETIPNLNSGPYGGDVLVRGESGDGSWGKSNYKICVSDGVVNHLQSECGKPNNNFGWRNALLRTTNASETKLINLSD